MDELDSNPNKCFEMFRTTHPYLLHLVDELVSHGYLEEGQGDVDATQVAAMLLYILGHNTRMRCVADRFQHSIKTVSRHFRRVLRALHSYARHLIKPDPDVICLPKHLRVNKYYPWFKFVYVHAGWEGSVNDSQVLEEAIGDPKHGFPWPPTGTYYLVDSGLPIGTSFLPPHKSTSFLRINNRCDELFNTWDNVEYEGNPIVLPDSGNNGASTSTAN
ncbi:uncharacterized protein LOC126720246 [Quercus robur]|uniref:uncharacterized protein LOC126720246 n=1 Tax=Quercus robur TaxID=38942 RepID=UPI002161654D|nr:uncharacterized protein LOC126720246 [Quercus robur]